MCFGRPEGIALGVLWLPIFFFFVILCRYIARMEEEEYKDVKMKEREEREGEVAEWEWRKRRG